jgi:hypothetical protein
MIIANCDGDSVHERENAMALVGDSSILHQCRDSEHGAAAVSGSRPEQVVFARLAIYGL